MKKMLLSIGSQFVLIFFYCERLLAIDSQETQNNSQHISTSAPSLGYLSTKYKDIDLNINPSLCSKETLMTFFPQPIVKAVLIQYGVNEEDAIKISKELSKKDQEVVRIVEEKSAKLDPNPLNDLNQRDVAVKIFGETLYEVFAKVLKSYKVSADDNQIQEILDNMKEIKGKLFVECIKLERQTERSQTVKEPAVNEPVKN